MQHRSGVRRQQAAVAAAFYGLPMRQREAIALQYYAHLSEIETARTIGLSLGSVKAHTARGIAELRAALARVSNDHGLSALE